MSRGCPFRNRNATKDGRWDAFAKLGNRNQYNEGSTSWHEYESAYRREIARLESFITKDDVIKAMALFMQIRGEPAPVEPPDLAAHDRMIWDQWQRQITAAQEGIDLLSKYC